MNQENRAHSSAEIEAIERARREIAEIKSSLARIGDLSTDADKVRKELMVIEVTIERYMQSTDGRTSAKYRIWVAPFLTNILGVLIALAAAVITAKVNDVFPQLRELIVNLFQAIRHLVGHFPVGDALAAGADVAQPTAIFDKRSIFALVWCAVTLLLFVALAGSMITKHEKVRDHCADIVKTILGFYIGALTKNFD